MNTKQMQGRIIISGITNSKERAISSVKLFCFHLARALECKFSGIAYYMHIMPSKTNLKHLNMTLVMDHFQDEYSVLNSLNIHQHYCNLVTLALLTCSRIATF